MCYYYRPGLSSIFIGNISNNFPRRHNFLSDLRSSGDRLNLLQTELAGLCARYSDLKSSVDQRLKWAVGANPALKEVVEGFSWGQAPLHWDITPRQPCNTAQCSV